VSGAGVTVVLDVRKVTIKTVGMMILKGRGFVHAR